MINSLQNKILPILLMLYFMLSCQNSAVNWPKNVTSSIWLAEDAQKIHYSVPEEGIYQVAYNVKVCYPAKEFIDKIVTEMKRREWKLLEFDYLDPRFKSNSARASAEWSYFIDARGKEEADVWQWIDDWEDGSRNLIRYLLKYTRKRTGGLKEGYLKSPETCELQVIVSYKTSAVRRAMEKEMVEMKSSQEKAAK